MNLHIVSGCFHTNSDRSVERLSGICVSVREDKSVTQLPPTADSGFEERERERITQFHREATPQTHSYTRTPVSSGIIIWVESLPSVTGPPCVITRQLKITSKPRAQCLIWMLSCLYTTQAPHSSLTYSLTHSQPRVSIWFQSPSFWTLRGAKRDPKVKFLQRFFKRLSSVSCKWRKVGGDVRVKVVFITI